jgi:hypothetical protein
MSADQSFLHKPERSANLIEVHFFDDQAMRRVEFRVCVHRRASAVSSAFLD